MKQTSSKAAPIIWRPTGKPEGPPSTNPHGNTIAGSPARFTLTCNKQSHVITNLCFVLLKEKQNTFHTVIMSPAYIANGSSFFSPILYAADGAAGEIRISLWSNAALKSFLISVLTYILTPKRTYICYWSKLVNEDARLPTCWARL